MITQALYFYFLRMIFLRRMFWGENIPVCTFVLYGRHFYIMSADEARTHLEKRFTRFMQLEEVSSLLDWDTAVMMPLGSAHSRAEGKAALRELSHERLTDPVVADWLEEAESMPSDDPWAAANLRAMRHRWIHATAVPSDLVAALARMESLCEIHWREALSGADFTRVAQSLTELVHLVQQVGQAKGERLQCLPYEALLDQYEPGARIDRLDALFTELEEDFLPTLLDSALTRQQPRKRPRLPAGPFATEPQRQLGVRFMAELGFDFLHGRLDMSHHPFCRGTCDDVRITTRYDTADFTSSLMAILHETGHALYELGLPRAWRWQPVGRACSASLHESQALLIEMQACRSREFLTYAAPLLRTAFQSDDPAWDAENLYRHYTWVEPSCIRVSADEVTYLAHVILRYHLEYALIEGLLNVRDIPAAWSEAMTSLLCVRPPNDRLGCLQDIHWYTGVFGYFPTYILGAMIAAQLFDVACLAEKTLLPGLACGNFTPLLTWLRSHVHAHGSFFLSADDLLRAATGTPLDASPLKTHLRRRYMGPSP